MCKMSSTEVNEASLVKWQNQAVWDTVWVCVFALCELQNILVGLIENTTNYDTFWNNAFLGEGEKQLYD